MSMLDTLRRLVRQQTTQVGQPVTNLLGGTAGETPPLLAAARQLWLWSRMPARGMLSTDEFYASFAANGGESSQVRGDEGVVIVNAGVQMVQMLRGIVRVPTSMSVQLAVATGSASGEYAVLVDGVLQRQGTDAVQLSVAMDRGYHLLEIVSYSAVLGVTVPPSLEIGIHQDALKRPQWASVDPGYLDPSMATTAVRLRWYNDARAGGWRLMRRELDDVGQILALGEADQQGRFAFRVAGDATALAQPGEEISAGTEPMGTVITAAYDATTDETSVLVRLSLEHAAPDPQWLYRPAGTGAFQELARIRRTSTKSVLKYDDLQVVVGATYEYRLQSFGLLDESVVSPWSEVVYVRAGDIEPPGPITFHTRYPRVTRDGIVMNRFTTPIDEDYAGVHVYFRPTPLTGTIAGADLSSVSLGADVLSGDYVGHTLLLSWSPEADTYGADAGGIIASHTASTAWVTSGFHVVPSGGATYQIYDDTLVITDFGTPNRDDEFVFDAVMSGDYLISGTYIYRSFDWTGNELHSGAPEIDLSLRYLTQPVTRVNFESKASDGTLSTIVVQATFATEPLIADLYSGDVGFLQDDQWRPSGGALFGPGDFAEGELDWMFVRVWAPNDPDVPVQVRRCVYVEEDGLVYVDQPFVTSGDYGVRSGDRWTVMDGATYYYEGLTKAPSKATLIPIYGPQFLVRASGAQLGKYVEFYSRIDGMLEEDLQRYLVDNDDLPQIRSLYLSEPFPYRLRVRIADLDDDVKYWKCYSKKTGAGRTRVNNTASKLWPTTTGDKDGPIDQAYLRWYEHIDQGLAFSHDAGEGTWRVIVVPENSIGTEGPRITGQKIIDGNPDEDSELLNLAVTSHDNVAQNRYGNLIYWEHNLESEEPVPTEVRIYARRADATTSSSTTTDGRTRIGSTDTAGGQTEITWTSEDGRRRVGELPTRRRWIDQDAESGSDPWIAEDDDGTEVRTLGGSFVHSGLPPRVGEGEGTTITWIYTVALHDHDTGELTNTPTEVKYTANYAITGGTGDPGVATLTAVGSSVAYPGSNTTGCTDPLVFRCSWMATNLTQDYYFTILEQNYSTILGDVVAGSEAFLEVVTSVPYTRRSWDFSQQYAYEVGSGLLMRHVAYTVQLRRASDGAVLQSMTSPQTSISWAACTG